MLGVLFWGNMHFISTANYGNFAISRNGYGKSITCTNKVLLLFQSFEWICQNLFHKTKTAVLYIRD